MLTNEQIDTLSDLFIDTAKGAFIAAITLTVITKADMFAYVRFLAIGISCVYASLKILTMKSI